MPNPPYDVLDVVEVVGQSRKVLDFGCAFGWFSPFFDDYIGVDLAPHRIELARRLYPKKRFVHVTGIADFGNWVCRGSFNDREVILCRSVLMHIPDDLIAELLTYFAKLAIPLVISEHLGRKWRGKDSSWLFNRELGDYQELLGDRWAVDEMRTVWNPRYQESGMVMRWQPAG
jgi:SAM-dependent methyltransferase